MAMYNVNGKYVEAPSKSVAVLKMVGISVALAKQLGIRVQRYSKVKAAYVNK